MQSQPRILRALLASFSALLFALLLPVPAPAQTYVGRPKLIVIVVIDQFRGDYLNRDHDKFKAPGSPIATTTTPTPRPRPVTPPSGPAPTPTATVSKATIFGTPPAPSRKK